MAVASVVGVHPFDRVHIVASPTGLPVAVERDDRPGVGAVTGPMASAWRGPEPVSFPILESSFVSNGVAGDTGGRIGEAPDMEP